MNRTNHRGGQKNHGSGITGNGRGHYNGRSTREFHSHARSVRPASSNTDLKVPYKSVQTWRNLMKRQDSLQCDKSKALRDLDIRQSEVERMTQTRFNELTISEKESMREKNKEKDEIRLKQDQLKIERERIIASEVEASTELLEDLTRQEEEMKTKNDHLRENLTDLEQVFAAREKKWNKEKAEETENFEIEKASLMDKYLAQVAEERKLEIEIQRFIQDMDYQITDMERRMRYNNTLGMEQEIHKQKQTIRHLNDIVEDLENRNIIQMEQMQQISSEYAFEKAQLLHQYEIERQHLVAQAKFEGVMEYMQGTFNYYPPPPPSHFDVQQSHPQTEFMAATTTDSALFTAQLQSNLFHHKKIPPSESSSSKSMNGVRLTDLRDRYEDLKTKAWTMKTGEHFNWSLSMIQKIVSYYESIGMRVYEETAPNKCISSLIWCPNDQLWPNKLEGCFATGHGETEEEATENSVQWAYSCIQKILNSDQDLENSDSNFENPVDSVIQGVESLPETFNFSPSPILEEPQIIPYKTMTSLNEQEVIPQVPLVFPKYSSSGIINIKSYKHAVLLQEGEFEIGESHETSMENNTNYKPKDVSDSDFQQILLQEPSMNMEIRDKNQNEMN